MYRFQTSFLILGTKVSMVSVQHLSYILTCLLKLWTNSNKYVEIRSMRSFLRGSIVLKLYPNQQSHPRYMSKHYYPGMMPIISFFHIIFSFVCKIADWKQVLLATHICHISRKPYSVKYFLVVDADPHSMTTARGANNINSNKP